MLQNKTLFPGVGSEGNYNPNQVQGYAGGNQTYSCSSDFQRGNGKMGYGANNRRMERYYSVAGHCFSVTADNDDLRIPENYEPFLSENYTPSRTIFALQIQDGSFANIHEDLRQTNEGQTIICGKTDDGSPVFEFQLCGALAGQLVCSEDYRAGCLRVTGAYKKFAIDNSLMIMYALATADKKTALFHATVVSYRGKGYMFLGPSGTGKSTHAALWQQFIPDVELVNDDNPIVRIDESDRATVYGSPWSGKTPCYRNISYPLGAIVMLSQAPHNKINRLSGIRAYAALLQSISGKRWEQRIADGLHATENELAANVPVWHLECRPDREAAEICKSTIASDD